MAIDMSCSKKFNNGTQIFPLVNESTIFDIVHMTKASYHSFTEDKTNGRWFPAELEIVRGLSYYFAPGGKVLPFEAKDAQGQMFNFMGQQRANCPLPFLARHVNPLTNFITINFTTDEAQGDFEKLIGHTFMYTNPRTGIRERYIVIGFGSSGKQGKVFAVNEAGIDYCAEYIEEGLKYDSETSRLGLSMCDATSGSLIKNGIYAEVEQAVILDGHHTYITYELIMKLIEENHAHISWDGLNYFDERFFKQNEQCQEWYPLEKVIWYSKFAFNPKSQMNYTVNQTLQPYDKQGNLKPWMRRILDKQDEQLMLLKSRGSVALMEYLKSSSRIRHYDEALEYESFEAEKFLNALYQKTGDRELMYYAAQTPMLRDTLSKSEIAYRTRVIMGEGEPLITGYAIPTFKFQGDHDHEIIISDHEKYIDVVNDSEGIGLRYPVMSDTATPYCHFTKGDIRSKNLAKAVMRQFRMNVFNDDKKIRRVDKGCYIDLAASTCDQCTIIPLTKEGKFLHPYKLSGISGVLCTDNTKINLPNSGIQSQKVGEGLSLTSIPNAIKVETAQYAEGHSVGVPTVELTKE